VVSTGIVSVGIVVVASTTIGAIVGAAPPLVTSLRMK